MQEIEIQQYIEVWQEREHRENQRVASMIAAFGNCIYGAAGMKAQLKASDFYSDGQPKKQSEAEMVRAAMVAFGAPPEVVRDLIDNKQSR